MCMRVCVCVCVCVRVRVCVRRWKDVWGGERVESAEDTQTPDVSVSVMVTE